MGSVYYYYQFSSMTMYAGILLYVIIFLLTVLTPNNVISCVTGFAFFLLFSIKEKTSFYSIVLLYFKERINSK